MECSRYTCEALRGGVLGKLYIGLRLTVSCGVGRMSVAQLSFVKPGDNQVGVVGKGGSRWRKLRNAKVVYSCLREEGFLSPREFSKELESVLERRWRGNVDGWVCSGFKREGTDGLGRKAWILVYEVLIQFSRGVGVGSRFHKERSWLLGRLVEGWNPYKALKGFWRVCVVVPALKETHLDFYAKQAEEWRCSPEKRGEMFGRGVQRLYCGGDVKDVRVSESYGRRCVVNGGAAEQENLVVDDDSDDDSEDSDEMPQGCGRLDKVGTVISRGVYAGSDVSGALKRVLRAQLEVAELELLEMSTVVSNMENID